MKPEYTLELPTYSDEFMDELISLASSVFARAEPHRTQILFFKSLS